jgi:hypothetical protein
MVPSVAMMVSRENTAVISPTPIFQLKPSYGWDGYWGGPNYDVTSWSPTSIVAQIRTSNTECISVSLLSGTSNCVNFIAMGPQTIASVSPTAGPVGTTVTITGTGFGSGYVSSVIFNGTNAAATAWSNTSIAVPVPSGAATGNVVVVILGSEWSNGVLFTVAR